MNELKECKKAIGIYAIVVVVLLSIIIGTVCLVTETPDTLTPRVPKNVEMTVNDGAEPLPHINVPVKAEVKNPSIVSVDKDGYIRAKKVGETVVTYFIDDKKIDVSVTVTKEEKKKNKKKGKK